MAEQMYITPSNDNQKSHIRDTRYVSNNDQLSDNIKKMMDLDIIRDLAMKNMTEDSTISYDVAFKIAKAEYYDEEIEIPIPPIEIEEEELVNETLDNNLLEDKADMNIISEVDIPISQKSENIVEPVIKSIEENSVPTGEKEEENELPKLVDFEDIIMPDINIDANVELPTEESLTNENDKIEVNQNIDEPIEKFDNIEKFEDEIKTDDIQIPVVENNQEEQLDTSKPLIEANDQLLDNLLDMDVTNNFSDLDSILLNNEEIFKTETTTQKIK